VLLPAVDDAPLQGPFAFSPGVVVPVPVLFVPALFVPTLLVPVPKPVVPGVVVPVGEDMPDVPTVDEPAVAPPLEPVAPPAAPPPAPPPPAPAAKAKLLETASVAASTTVAIFITSSFSAKQKEQGISEQCVPCFSTVDYSTAQQD
jgi:hypothetical protein